MAKTANRKFRSVKRNKRRGFFGRRPAQIREEQGITESSTLEPVAGPSSASSISPVEERKTPQSASTPVRENVSLRKLQNSSFERYETDQGMLTRRNANNVGMGSSPQVEAATGFKLQDAVLLTECISVAAICSSCKIPGSKLKHFQRNDQREGLAESLFMKCSSCEFES